MSDDLISRKVLLEKVKDYFISPNGALRLIESQPTAYDADKVIQRITELQLKIKDKSLAVEDEEYAVMLRGQLRGIADCLEIIKSGGAAND